MARLFHLYILCYCALVLVFEGADEAFSNFLVLLTFN